MAENNSSAPLKTAEGAYPALPAPVSKQFHGNDDGWYGFMDARREQATMRSGEWPIRELFTAEQMRAYAAQAVAAQAAPAAVAVPGEREAYIDWLSGSHPRVFSKTDAEAYWRNEHVSALAWQARAALAATPALPATEDSSAGDLAEPDARAKVTLALGLGAGPQKFAWSYLLGQISELVKCEQELILLKVGIARSKAQAEELAEPLCWVFEDELPASLTTEAYNALFSRSKVDGVRMFPVFGPQPAPQAQPADALDAETIKKAARYDWLRSGNDYQSDGPMVVLYESEGDRGDRPYWSIASDALDASIDAAMAAAQEGGNA